MSYYPPRARWYTRGPYYLAQGIRRCLHLDRIHLPQRLTPRAFLLGLLVPGYAFLALGRRLVGWCFLGGYVVAVAVFLAALGYPASNVAYGLFIGIHATSILYLERQWLADSHFYTRLVAALCTLLALWGAAYRPLVGLVDLHWLMPVRTADRVLVIQRSLAPGAIRRGDWIVFRIGDASGEARRLDGLVLEGGLGSGPVLALPGDRVEFTSQSALVNGQPIARAPFMPTSGGFVVPEKVWFIWPDLAITRRGNPVADVPAAMQQTAMVSQDQLMGRPFRTWFGRRQWP